MNPDSPANPEEPVTLVEQVTPVEPLTPVEPSQLHDLANPVDPANPENFREGPSVGGAIREPVIGRLDIPKPPKPLWRERVIRRQTLGRGDAATVLGSSVFGGVCILLASKSGPATMATTLACFVAALTLIITAQLRRRTSLLMVGAALILASFLVVRTSPWLVSLDVIMIVTLGIGAASYNRAGTLWGPMSIIGRRLLRSMFSVPAGASEGLLALSSLLPAPTEITPDRRAAASSTLRGLLIATPLLLIMLGLFASADPVFASYVHIPTINTGWFNNGVIVLLGTMLLLGLVRLAKAEHNDPVLTKKAGTGELSVVLGGFVLLYATFAFTQVAAAIGGATYVNERTGGSYKEYARSGFFQLLIASAITLVLLFVARGSLERREGSRTRSVRVLSLVLCVLSIVVVLASMQRIALYSQEFGQTMLRVYSSTFAGWLGMVFALVGVATVIPAKRQWIAPASLALAVAGLIGMNLYNPEAHVAKTNLDRALTTGDLYTTYFSKLSADSVPTIANGIAKLTGQLKIDSTTQVCEFLKENPALYDQEEVLSYNRSQRNAAASVHKLCDRVADSSTSQPSQPAQAGSAQATRPTQNQQLSR
jgi:Domain of unknown function (DUF4173)